jgi:16S rRNA G1207 methylase RsmC
MADSKLQDDKQHWVYVEFGAGRGYLSHMLCDSYGISSVVLVERSAYKFKVTLALTALQSSRWAMHYNKLSNRFYARFSVGSLIICRGPQADRTLRQVQGVSVERIRTDSE